MRRKSALLLRGSELIAAVDESGTPFWAGDDGGVYRGDMPKTGPLPWTAEHKDAFAACYPDTKAGWGIVRSPSGRMLRAHGRPRRMDWFRLPAAIGERLYSCGRSRQFRVTDSGAVREVRLGCSSVLCSVCLPDRGLAKALAIVPPIDAARVAGCPVLHATITSRPWSRGGAVRPWEAIADEVAAPHCATLPEAIQRCRDAWEVLSRGRGNLTDAEWYTNTVLSAVASFEVTERKDDGGSRWHAHAHVILILHPDTEVLRGATRRAKGGRSVTQATGEWVVKWRAAWSRAVATVGGVAMAVAQDVTWCDDIGAIMEASKYPAKLGELSDGAALQWIAWAPSARLRTLSGALHGGSRLGRRVTAHRNGNGHDETDIAKRVDQALCAIAEATPLAVDDESAPRWLWVYEAMQWHRLTTALAERLLTLPGAFPVAMAERDGLAALDTLEGIHSEPKKNRYAKRYLEGPEIHRMTIGEMGWESENRRDFLATR